MSMAVVFKLWSPDTKHLNDTWELVRNAKPQVPTDSLGLGPSHLHFNKVPGSYGYGQLEEAQALRHGALDSVGSLPRFAQLACGPLSRNSNLQEQMAPCDSSVRTDMK